jgi:hypothetical protein
MNESAYLDQVASLAGLRRCPRQGPWGNKSGCVIGVQDGYVTVIGLTRDQKQSKIVVILRFKKMEQPEMLKTALGQSPALSQTKQGKLAATGSDFLRWEWKYSFTKPKAADVIQLANTLREAIKPVVQGFDGRCEKCQRTSTPELTLMNGLPLYICAGCQDAVRQEQDQAATNYEALQPNYPNGIALGIGAAIAGGAAWGLVAYLLHYVFLYGAILIGYFVSWGMLKGTGKVTRMGQISIPILTVSSILLGDAIYFTLEITKERNLILSVDLFKAVLANLWGIERSGNGAASVIFALIGAAYALYRARKPKLKAVF